MKKLARLLSLTVVLGVAAGAAPLHFSVSKSTPSKDDVLADAPKRLQIWFSQAPAAAVSEIKLKKGAEDVPVGKTEVVAAEKTMFADPVKPLENGGYVISWRAAGDDGHVLNGEVKFTVDVKKTP